MSKDILAEQQSSPEVSNEDSETPALSDFQEEAASPSSTKTPRQKSSHPSADEEPGSPQTEALNSDEWHDKSRTQFTTDLSALTKEDCPSEFPPTVTNVNAPHLSNRCHLHQALENSGPTGERQDGSDETAEIECIVTAKNLPIPPPTAVSTAAAEEQERVQPNRHTELLDDTDVCVSKEI